MKRHRRGGTEAASRRDRGGTEAGRRRARRGLGAVTDGDETRANDMASAPQRERERPADDTASTRDGS